jgi:type IV fimbrial biogenesis protein FimT
MRAHRREAHRGFTLVEVMTVLTLVAIGLSLVLPSVRQAVATQRVRTSATDLVSTLLLARSEAIKRKGSVSVAPLGTSWSDGWQARAVNEGDALERKDALGDGVDITRAPDAVVYDRNGRLATPAVVRFELGTVPASPTIRCITIEPGGLPRLAEGACP